MNKYKLGKKISIDSILIKILITILLIIYFISLVLVQLKVSWIASSVNESFFTINKNHTSLHHPVRGNFYDLEYTKLTDNLNEYIIYLDYFKLLNSINTHSKDEISNYISTYINLSKHYIAQKIQESLEKKINIEIKTAKIKNIDTSLKNLDLLPIKIQLKLNRTYYYGEELSNIIGYVGKVSLDELKSDSFYNFDSIVGKYKLEQQLEGDLRGKFLLKNNNEYKEEYIPGNSVILNINSKWQKSLYKILSQYTKEYDAAFGGAVILETSSGKVRALVSYPGFDSNKISNLNNLDYYNKLINSRSKPFLDKTISQAAAPGSTFKLISAHGLLENDKISINDNYYSNRCIKFPNGQEFCEYGKFFYGNMNIIRAIYKSSNLFFCNYTLKTNATDFIVKSAKEFNLENFSLIDLPGEVTGNIDSPQKRKSLGNEWYDGDSCNIVIGQGATSVTPIQMAAIIAAFENNGKYYVPYVVDKIIDHNGLVIKEFTPRLLKAIDVSKSRDIILTGMREGVTNSEGIVRSLNYLPNNVKAKTGTAESFELVNGSLVPRTHGWIVGSFEYENILYSFTVHLNNGIEKTNAIPVVKNFLECLNKNFINNC